jgi:hypothetical protein
MEILVHLPWWIWLLLSITPYSIKRRRGSNMQSLVLSALFWQFSLTSQKGRYAWSFSLPWVRRVQRSRAQRKLLASAWRKLIQEGAKKLLSFWR